MTNKEIWRIAMEQSAADSGCRWEDFTRSENMVVLSRPNPQARKYLQLPFFCDLTSYGSNIVASVSPEFAPAALEYINKYPVEHCFETPNLHMLNQALAQHQMMVCFMAEYFLPNAEKLEVLPCPYEVRLMEAEEFSQLYQPQWGNAFCAQRRQLDCLAAGAFYKGGLVGLAGCSADCETMWQIGVDVLPGYRRQGVAAAVTSRLATAILERGKIPFYCAAWSNIPSVRNAIKSGFVPGWVQVTAKPTAFVAQMNGKLLP